MKTRAALLGYAFLLVIGTGMAFWYGSASDHSRYPYTPDSSGYIERARTLLGSGNLVANPLFPPGYPLLISAAASFGLDPVKAALLLVRIGYAALPALLAWVLRKVVDDRSNVAIAVLVALSPGLWYIGSTADSDLPFMVLVLAGFAFMLRWAGSFSIGAAFTAGLLLGAAYVVRNAGLAAFAAVATVLAAGAVFRWLPPRRTLAFAAAFAFGAALPVAPLLLWNYVEFGHLQPYSMPPSDIALVTNMRIYIEQAVLDLVGSSSIARHIAWDYRLLLGAGIGFTALLVVRGGLQWPKLKLQEKVALMLFASYFAAGASMVILARTLYQWGELINLRHVVQYDWTVYPIAALLLGWNREDVPRRPARIAVAVAVAFLISGRLLYLAAEYRRNSAMHSALVSTGNPLLAVAAVQDRGWVWTRTLKREIADDRGLLDAINSIPAGADVKSNRADVLQIETGRSVGSLSFDSSHQLAAKLARLPHSPPSEPRLDVLLFPTDLLLKNGQWAVLLAQAQLAPGYKIVADVPDLLWLRSE